MKDNSFRGATAISGVGWTDLTKDSGESALTLATRAGLAAIDDAGLDATDIDGLVTFYWGARDTPAPQEMAGSLGLTSCRMSFCDSSGGAWACAAIAAAAMAVFSGTCRNVLVYRASNSRSEPLPSTADFWPSGWRQWSEPFGATHAATLYGPAVSAYMSHYEVTNTDFAPLAVQQRLNASLNRKALMRKPISIEDHQKSPWIIDPFRLLDCSVFNDGGMAIVVSASDDVRAKGRSVVTIRAVEGGTIGTPVTARTARHRWDLNAVTAAPSLYEKAGISAEDIDVAEVYDPFTGMTLLHIEQFGLAEAGHAARRIRAGDMALDGKLPVNTHGGHLSEGNVGGLGHVVEAFQQLRDGGVRDDYCPGDHDYDRRRCRQVRDADTALVVGESGDSSLVLVRTA